MLKQGFGDTYPLIKVNLRIQRYSEDSEVVKDRQTSRYLNGGGSPQASSAPSQQSRPAASRAGETNTLQVLGHVTQEGTGTVHM